MLTNPVKLRSTRRMSALAGLVALLLGAAALARYAAYSPPRPEAKSQPPAAQLRPITAGELDYKYGIRVTLVAVTAAGGLVDIRFRVLDHAKAEVLFLPGNLPSIIAADGRTTIQPPPQPESPTLADGQIYFLLYPNSSGAVKPGSNVVLAFGDLGLESQVAP